MKSASLIRKFPCERIRFCGALINMPVRKSTLWNFPLLQKSVTLKQVLKVGSMKIYIHFQWRPKKKKRSIQQFNRIYVVCSLSPIFRYINIIKPNLFLLKLSQTSQMQVAFLANILVCHISNCVAQRLYLQPALCPYSLLTPFFFIICNLLYYQTFFFLCGFLNSPIW